MDGNQATNTYNEVLTDQQVELIKVYLATNGISVTRAQIFRP